MRGRKRQRKKYFKNRTIFVNEGFRISMIKCPICGIVPTDWSFENICESCNSIFWII